LKLLFLGSPTVAVPFLEECVRNGHEICAVVTQPDRPSGRGMALSPPPVKEAAMKRGLRILQPEKMADVRAELESFQADVAIVVAFGRMLGPKTLGTTRLGFLNVHFSLLPEYRGAAPVQRALMDGKKKSGVTLFWIVKEMDAGPIQRRAEIDVPVTEDAPELFKRLIELGVCELRAVLSDLSLGKVVREEQAGEPSFAPKIESSEARLSFELSAAEFHNKVRGLRGGPKAYLWLSLPGKDAPTRLTVLKTLPEKEAEGEPGRLVSVDEERGILVQCRLSRCWITDVQPEGKKPVKAVDFLNGARLKQGDRLITAV